MTRKTAKEVLLSSCRRLDLNPKDVCGNSRKQPLTTKRQEIMFDLFTQCPHFSTPEIGRILGWRDHTTILHGVRRHAERIGINYEMAVAMRIERGNSLGMDMHKSINSPFTNSAFKGLMAQYGHAMRASA